MKEKILSIITIVVGIIIVLSIAGPLLSQAKDAAGKAQYPTNNCSTAAGESFNALDAKCYNSSMVAVTAAATSNQLPLAGLFSPTGILLVVLLVALFLVLMYFAWSVK